MIGWVKAFEKAAQMLDAVALMCKITDNDYAYYSARRTHLVGDMPLRNALQVFSPDFGDILDIITRTLNDHAKNPRVPSVCEMALIDLSAYRTAWIKHVTTEAQSQLELCNIAGEARDKILARLKTLWEEDIGGEYSSYSDYSEETESEETNDEEEEEDEDDRQKQSRQRSPTSDKPKEKEKHRKRAE